VPFTVTTMRGSAGSRSTLAEIGDGHVDGAVSISALASDGAPTRSQQFHARHRARAMAMVAEMPTCAASATGVPSRRFRSGRGRGGSRSRL
jgi:hypothetical protein